MATRNCMPISILTKNSYVNTQNYRFWGSEIPYVNLQMSLHLLWVTVWCGAEVSYHEFRFFCTRSSVLWNCYKAKTLNILDIGNPSPSHINKFFNPYIKTTITCWNFVEKTVKKTNNKVNMEELGIKRKGKK